MALSMGPTAKVAISSDFLSAFVGLPQVVQVKVSKFLSQFQRDPTGPGINYERINAARDPNMRSVRIDDFWRGIVLKPEQGNIFLLLWVDRHNDAYAWARRHRCAVNATTGAIQVIETVQTQESESVPVAKTLTTPRLFQSLSDSDLLLLGVPIALLPTVRALHSESDLDALQSILPAEAYEGLFLVLAGDPVERILAERDQQLDHSVNTDDFHQALDQVESRARFVIVDNETELAAVLKASLAQWRIFLHPSQRRLAEGVKSGPVRVLGGAGTGKTVVAMHRAKWLAEHGLPEGEKVLFTTFTRNLALDIEANLRELCPSATLARIEVVNLDLWVQRFLRGRSDRYEIVYGVDADLWKAAMRLKPATVNVPDRFYREEWQRIIQPQGIETLEEYKRASRIGRGTTLNRIERGKIWPVFGDYRRRLIQSGKREVDDAYRDATQQIMQNRSGLPYTAVIVDEAQDMGPSAFRLLRALVATGANDLFIVGDGHQRIYGRNKVVLSQCGIDIRGRSRKLWINYRTTEETRRAAVGLLEGCTADDLDGGTDPQKGYRSLTHGEPPVRRHFASADEQAVEIARLIKTTVMQGTLAAAMCVVARTHRELDDIEHRLQAQRLSTQRIQVDATEAGTANAVRLATMHRVKGLEFDTVIAASINDRLVPPQSALETADPVERATIEREERSLLYVALTRARKQAYLFSYGSPSRLLIEI